MTTDINNVNRIFKKMILTISVFLISFFALTPVKAASFKYSEFDWDKFAEKLYQIMTTGKSNIYNTDYSFSFMNMSSLCIFSILY